MKPLLKITILLIVISYGCSKTNIIGTWEIASGRMTLEFDTKTVIYYSNIENYSDTGKWTINSDSLLLNFKYDTWKASIIKLNNDSIELIIDSNETLTLTRLKRRFQINEYEIFKNFILNKQIIFEFNDSVKTKGIVNYLNDSICIYPPSQKKFRYNLIYNSQNIYLTLPPDNSLIQVEEIQNDTIKFNYLPRLVDTVITGKLYREME